MVGRIIGERDTDVILMHKCEKTLHELGAPTMVLGYIIQIDEECGDLGKALSQRFPPLSQTIDQTIASHFGGYCVEKDLIGGGQENADWCHHSSRLKIMVCGLRWDATLPSARKRTNLDRSLGIHR